MAIANVEEQIKMLIELQELDREIFNRKRALEIIPEKIKELDAMMDSKTNAMKNLDEEYKKIQLKRKEKEVELDSKEQSIKKYQSQLYQVKTNKEYSSLEKEIASIKADNSLLEEEIITLLDNAEGIQKEIAKEKAIFEEEKKKIDGQKREVEEEKKTAEAELKGLNGKREEFTARIDKNILAKYERILHNKDGLAMVPIVEGACGGCNMNLPPQVVNETQLKKDFTFCGNCARMLYVTE
ncbi:MAG: hypothetical protein JW994_03950 [Candidatus Omnitrophica bacterium]|nr:hypothetical protein [Candidatus Omnitrophota bacterium]